jgi:hypothetical protein
MINTATGVTSAVTSNSTGNYTFPVPAGNYDVKAEMSGFKTEEVKGLRVETAPGCGRTSSSRSAPSRRLWRSRRTPPR